MASFFERPGYSSQTLKDDLDKTCDKMKHQSQSNALPKSNSMEEKMSRIPLILTYHPLNSQIKRILLDNFKVITDDPATRHIFPPPSIIAFQQQLANIVSSHGRNATCNTRRLLSVSTPTLPYFWSYFQWVRTPGVKGSHSHQRVLHLLVLFPSPTAAALLFTVLHFLCIRATFNDGLHGLLPSERKHCGGNFHPIRMEKSFRWCRLENIGAIVILIWQMFYGLRKSSKYLHKPKLHFVKSRKLGDLYFKIYKKSLN